MLAFLKDPTITKFGTDIEKEKATKTFCQQFCNTIGQPFDESVFIVSATTNTAAAQVQGDTIHSLVG